MYLLVATNYTNNEDYIRITSKSSNEDTSNFCKQYISSKFNIAFLLNDIVTIEMFKYDLNPEDIFNGPMKVVSSKIENYQLSVGLNIISNLKDSNNNSTTILLSL
jgi:hypothetical protein